ncbi:hypothetical protein JTE87_04134 [Bacillus amyloliquefaciens]|nr:hypothetical protein [Bacillus subtilis]MCB5337131.1 hypothetical protein [Bacillus amyloliquefaciens]
MSKLILSIVLVINLFYILNYLFEIVDPFNILSGVWLAVFVFGVIVSLVGLFRYRRLSGVGISLALGVLVTAISSLGVYGFYFLMAT